MKLPDLQETMTGLFRSESLKKKIYETSHTFSAEECLSIIYRYAKDFDERIVLWTVLEKAAPSVSERAEKCINWQFDELDMLKKCGEGEVYELHIKETPSSYDERYLCTSFDAALDAIDAFYKEYDFAEKCPETRYWIVKRKLYGGKNDIFDEDFLGECTLDVHKNIIDITPVSGTEYGECEYDCEECEHICAEHIEVLFPNFLERFSPVKYYDADGEEKYGIMPLRANDLMDEYYIVPLDIPIDDKCDPEESCFWCHEHILPPFIEKITVDELPEDVKERYFSVRKYFETID